MRLGEMLIARGLIGQEDLDRALEIQKERGEKIGKILVDLGFVAGHDVLSALSEQLSVPLVTVEEPPVVMMPAHTVTTSGHVPTGWPKES
jgi:general secretion pathway protein E